MKKNPRILVLALLALGGAAYAYTSLKPATITLTGIVTTHDVFVSPQVGGQLGQLLVSEGDTVKKDQLLAMITPDELKADTAYYTQNAAGLSSQVLESEAALRFEQSATDNQTAQAVSTLAATEAQVQAAAADLEVAKATYTRTQDLARQQIASAQDLDQARAASDAAQAKLLALRKQVEAQRATVALARANAEQVTVRRSQVQASQHQEAAAAAQRAKADVRLAYTEIHAPDRRVRRRARRARRRVREPGPAHRDPRQSRRPLGARRRRRDLHRPRPHRRHAHGAAALGRRAPRHRLLPRRRRRLRHPARREPHQARHQDLRDPAAASTTTTARSPLGMTAYVALPVR